MYVTIVNVSVSAEYVDEFIAASLINHKASVREPGNRRFDVLQNAIEPTKFVLYEAYDSEADAKAHKDTDHYATWRETVAHMMAEPRQSVTYAGLAPQA
ncbi:MAG: antibiotic biosynthesis monooxygenase [Rhodospirillales bacterium]|nr:antibiotic biosynthesis monooxygenase [Rhodospirillales bacterium]